jgi:hypothetical protein
MFRYCVTRPYALHVGRVLLAEPRHVLRLLPGEHQRVVRALVFRRRQLDVRHHHIVVGLLLVGTLEPQLGSGILHWHFNVIIAPLKLN